MTECPRENAAMSQHIGDAGKRSGAADPESLHASTIPARSEVAPQPSPAGGVAGGQGSSRHSEAAGDYILLIDDQEDNQYLVQELLEWKGYRVKVAGSGAAGLRRAVTERPGLVLMDMTMPVMDGYETTQRMRALPGCENVPIIALTAYDVREAGQRCFDAGCVAFLAKPFEPDDLVKLVLRFLGPSAPRPGAPVTPGS